MLTLRGIGLYEEHDYVRIPCADSVLDRMHSVPEIVPLLLPKVYCIFNDFSKDGATEPDVVGEHRVGLIRRELRHGAGSRWR